MKNCINCGAPPRSKSVECLFCGTALRVVVKEADEAAFRRSPKAMRACDFDDGRLGIAQAIARLDTKFTAGQARALANTCDFDDTKGLTP